jgi:hypothetical protein
MPLRHGQKQRGQRAALSHFFEIRVENKGLTEWHFVSKRKQGSYKMPILKKCAVFGQFDKKQGNFDRKQRKSAPISAPRQDVKACFLALTASIS